MKLKQQIYTYFTAVSIFFLLSIFSIFSPPKNQIKSSSDVNDQLDSVLHTNNLNNESNIQLPDSNSIKSMQAITTEVVETSSGVDLQAEYERQLSEMSNVDLVDTELNEINSEDVEKIQSNEPYYAQVDADGLYLRSEPSKDGVKVCLLNPDEKIQVKDTDTEGWVSTTLDGTEYYLSKEYLTTDISNEAKEVSSVKDKIEADLAILAAKKEEEEKKKNAAKKSSNKKSSSKSSPYIPNVQECIGETNPAKEWIAFKESSGSYSAKNGSFIGRYQLHYSLLNGDYSPSNQEAAAEKYVAERYGSWENAKAFWVNHNWY